LENHEVDFLRYKRSGLRTYNAADQYRQEIRRMTPCEILFATNSSFVDIFNFEKFAYVCGGEHFNDIVSIRKKECDRKGYIDKNDQFLLKTIQENSPDIVVLDFVIFPKTIDYCRRNKIFIVFILREFTTKDYLEPNKISLALLILSFMSARQKE